tara:strand:+ start:276 stop:422 length:147 start_codon:yes stop_codon:yes gene_type:complete
MDEKLRKLLSGIPKDSRGWLELRKHIQETFLKEAEKVADQNAQDAEDQ